LDTTVLIDLAGRGNRSRKVAVEELLAALVTEGHALTTTRFNLAELYVGVHRGSDPTVEMARVEKLVSHLTVLEFDDLSARLFGSLMAGLLRVGRPVGDMDVLIASVAIAHGKLLVTRNQRHFAEIPGLTVRGYA